MILSISSKGLAFLLAAMISSKGFSAFDWCGCVLVRSTNAPEEFTVEDEVGLW